jgi:zinc transport system ATP-binding protein
MPPNNPPALELKNVSVYYGKHCALEDISFSLQDNDYLGIIGPNGGGKTTLLKAILGLIKFEQGQIRIYGEELNYQKVSLGYVPQSTFVERSFPVSVLEVVLMGLLPSGLKMFQRYSPQDLILGRRLLSQTSILHLQNRMISELSGGEFQKLLIARALAVNPRMLLLDEPTANVDASSRDQIFTLLKELNRSMTIILVSHDLSAISAHVRSLACLDRKLVYHGSSELTDPIVQQLYGCPVDLLAHGVPHRVLKTHEGHH